jgi:hypothetical protein
MRRRSDRAGTGPVRGQPLPDRARRGAVAAIALAGVGLWLLALAPAVADPRLPWIVEVGGPRQMRVGMAGTLSVTYRAPRGNVVAVIQETEDLDGSATTRTTRQREHNVVARAFGYERGQLVLPLSFATTGWKLVRLHLVTDDRQTSDPVSIEVEVLPP